jgi:multimeric flavodoxin WrbA
MAEPKVRTGMPSVELTKDEFARRFRKRFYDPAFERHDAEIAALIDVAWDAYEDGRKAPRTQRAGPGFADPDYEISIEWLEASRAIAEAERRQKDPAAPSRILLVNGSARSDQTCPGEISKTYRLFKLAEDALREAGGVEIDLLDLSRLASEYGRVIYPCKACVSTAMPLCHWPCSCYPNHGQDQTGDWMNEIYPRWAAAHGVMIVTPVYWYQAPSPLKLMMDRLVCADGGNPDPTSTHGKRASEAKRLELDGWHYPRHLAGRVFSLVVHGDAAGAGTLRRSLSDWLTDMNLVPASPKALVDRYIDYMGRYATSHDALDEDKDLQEEVRNAALTLAEAVKLMRAGALPRPGAALGEPRPK